MAEQLLAKHTDDFFVHLKYQDSFEGVEHRQIIDRYKTLAGKHPGDPVYRLLFAQAQLGFDTPQAISVAESLVASNPSFPRTYLLLTDIYGWGKFKNSAKAQQNLQSFVKACPTSLDPRFLQLAQRYADTNLAAKLAPPLSKRLSSETDPDRLQLWAAVWNLEFKARPIGEHEKLRSQVLQQLSGLQSSNKRPDAEWFMFMKEGYTIAGAKAQANEQEAQMVQQFPHSSEASRVLSMRWDAEHPWPGNDDVKLRQYYRASLTHTEESLKFSPSDTMLLANRFQALSQLDDTSVEQLAAAGDALLAASHKYRDVSSFPPFEMRVAEAYAKRKMRLNEIPELVKQGLATNRKELAGFSDRYPASMGQNRIEDEDFLTRQAARILLDAAKELNQPEIAREAVAKAQALKSDKPYEKMARYQIEAKWAELQGQKLDALLFYRAAMSRRPAEMKPSKKDDLADEMNRLWKELGGTEASRTLLAADAAKPAIIEEGKWKKPEKEMVAWKLSDLQGKTWTLASLEGKTVLINVWASWCGPCKAEHPHLQKLYEKVKDDPNIQIVTFNTDDEIGKVAPYVNDGKYTFPVLLAKDYADSLSVMSIPRNWLVNKTGKWQSEQIGFGSEEKWEDEMLQKIKSVSDKK